MVMAAYEITWLRKLLQHLKLGGTQGTHATIKLSHYIKSSFP